MSNQCSQQNVIPTTVPFPVMCSQQCYISTFIQVTAYYFFCWTHNCVSVQGHMPHGPFQSALLWDCFSWLPPNSTMYRGIWKDYIAAMQTTLSLILDISTVENSILEVLWDGSRGRCWTHLLPQTQKLYSYLWNKQKPLRTSWVPASQQKKEGPKITRRGGERETPARIPLLVCQPMIRWNLKSKTRCSM